MVKFTTGHGEWLGGWNLRRLEVELRWQGYIVEAMPYPITPHFLIGVGVLIVGNAWASFTDAEIEAIRYFVESGGGLLLVGTGWAWPSANKKYPMDKVAEPFGLVWLRNIIPDFTNQMEDSPVFYTFFPEAEACSFEEVRSDILSAHQAYPSRLHIKLETVPELRQTYSRAHLFLSLIPVVFPSGSSERKSVFQFNRDIEKRSSSRHRVEIL